MQRPTARHIFQRKDINCNVPLDSSPKSSGTKQKVGGGNCRHRRGQRKAEEHGPLNQLSRPHKDSPRLKRKAQGLHGSVPVR